MEKILLVLVGQSPGVLTFTLWKLLHAAEPDRFVPTRILVLTTTDCIETFEEFKRKGFPQFLEHAIPAGSGFESHVLTNVQCLQIARAPEEHQATTGGSARRVRKEASDQKGNLTYDQAIKRISELTNGWSPLADIKNSDHANAAADFVALTLGFLTSIPGSTIHASIAGGRATMGAALTSAMSLWGRAQDRISHVLPEGRLERRVRKDPYVAYPEPREAKELHLAQIPFVRARHSFRLDVVRSFKLADLVRFYQVKDEVLTDPRNFQLHVSHLPKSDGSPYGWSLCRAKDGETVLVLPSPDVGEFAFLLLLAVLRMTGLSSGRYIETTKARLKAMHADLTSNVVAVAKPDPTLESKVGSLNGGIVAYDNVEALYKKFRDALESGERVLSATKGGLVSKSKDAIDSGDCVVRTEKIAFSELRVHFATDRPNAKTVAVSHEASKKIDYRYCEINPQLGGIKLSIPSNGRLMPILQAHFEGAAGITVVKNNDAGLIEFQWDSPIETEEPGAQGE